MAPNRPEAVQETPPRPQARLEDKVQLRPILADDAPAMAAIIRQVGAEYGAIGEGFGPSDPEVEALHRHYLAARGGRYLVAEAGGRVLGGAGIAALDGEPGTCELKKLFLLPEARGRGLGLRLARACLAFAREAGYQACYLDSLSSMTAAIALYRRLGFAPLNAPLAASIHGGCDVWMLKQL